MASPPPPVAVYLLITRIIPDCSPPFWSLWPPAGAAGKERDRYTEICIRAPSSSTDVTGKATHSSSPPAAWRLNPAKLRPAESVTLNFNHVTHYCTSSRSLDELGTSVLHCTSYLPLHWTLLITQPTRSILLTPPTSLGFSLRLPLAASTHP